MWKDLDFDQMEKESWTYVPYPPLSKKEIEEIVVSVRLNLYNDGKNCGPAAISQWMNERAIVPLPSLNKIAAILRRNCLTHGRTGPDTI